MKNTLLNSALILILSFSIVLISSCKKEDEDDAVKDDLIGTWTLGETSVEITVGNMDVIQYMVAIFGFPENEAQMAVDSLITEINNDNTGTINFEEDNTYHLILTNSNEEEYGTWSVSNNGNTLNLYFYDGEDNLPILSLTASSLHLEIPTEFEDVDLDDDGVNETTLEIGGDLRLSK